jgi:sugar/nucleoside kinase (ribokinase family)
MTVLVVGSVALDSVETPFGKADHVLGGSGTFFSASASHLAPVQLVGVIGNDFPIEDLRKAFANRPIDISGLEQQDGASFRWRGRYRHDLNMAETLETHLGVFSNFRPKIPDQFRNAPFVFLGNIDPRLQLEVLEQVSKPEARRVRYDEFLDREPASGLDAAARAGGSDRAQRRRGAPAHRGVQPREGGSMDHGPGPKYVLIKKGEHGAFMFTADTIFFAPAYPLESVFDPTGAG